MHILAVADTVSKYLYDYYTPDKLKGFDLILCCGDLSRDYLEFLVDASTCPVVYVRGNHDDDLEDEPPGGCICAEDRVLVLNGVKIAGLGGSHRYREGRNMFTERQMQRRVRRLKFKIMRRGGVDILLAHSPARNVNDFDSLSHRGFECFNELIEKYHPKYFVHGHIHKNYGKDIPQLCEVGDTLVVNAYDHVVFDFVCNCESKAPKTVKIVE